MIVSTINEPPISGDVRNNVTRIIREVLQAITTDGSQFVVNDTVWYMSRPRGQVSPCVVNSATYISRSFQQELALRKGWRGETTSAGQRIDGYGEVGLNSQACQLSRDSIIDFLEEYADTTKVLADIGLLFKRFYNMYVARSCFTIDKSVPNSLHHYFTSTPHDDVIRIGLEFETGNIASSFRAFQKLDALFSAGKIDVGVFVTSFDKANCATRIWPGSNRNGSFEELRNRNYQENIAVPLWEFGFQPDRYDSSAMYLGSSCELYEIVPKCEDRTISGQKYEIFFGEDNQEVLKPVGGIVGTDRLTSIQEQ